MCHSGNQLAIRAGPAGSHLLLLGGAPMDGPRHLFWNVVSSSRQRIEQAKVDRAAGRLAAVPGDETEFIPLPDPSAARPPGAQAVAEGSATS